MVLLGLYVYAVQFAIAVVSCLETTGCSSHSVANFTEGFGTVITTVGGLVSALVISELAITEPGEVPVARVLGASPSTTASRTLKIVTASYLLIWLVTGLTAFIYGAMLHPGTLQALTDTGKAWLGLAVAAGYSYFALKPAVK